MDRAREPSPPAMTRPATQSPRAELALDAKRHFRLRVMRTRGGRRIPHGRLSRFVAHIGTLAGSLPHAPGLLPM